MRLNVLFFGSLAHDLDVTSQTLELSDNATVADALDTLASSHGAVARHRDRMAVAVNLEYVEPSHVLKHGDELALIPPVSGG